MFAGVVAGIAHYGNCFGIPTIAGEVYFDKTYEGNPLVNAFCLGVLRHEQIARGAAKGVGNPVFYVGPATGRDGLAGAAFASQDLTEESAEQQRGAVQVGDPFMEKLVLRSLPRTARHRRGRRHSGHGRGGSDLFDLRNGRRAGTGIEIELDKVPQRAPNMTQLRNHAQRIAGAHAHHRHKGREEEVKRIFDKWDLPWAEIGLVTSDGMMRVRNNGTIVAEIPAKALADEAPLYSETRKRPL